MTEAGCPSLAELRQLIIGALDEDRLVAIENHLGDCLACQKQLDAMSGADELSFADLQGDSVRAQVPLELIESGRKITPSALQSDEEIEEMLQGFLDPSQDESRLGTLGEYEVVDYIARGGMGMVLRAWEPALARFVAIKVLAPELAASSSARERFTREARAAAAIDHENVLPIYGVDEKGVLPYLVMPYIDGENLQQRLDRESVLPPEDCIRVAEGMARGLCAAHEKGLVHRDVKPANILIDRETGRIWVTDFGLARAAEEISLTRSGTLIGTPQYMAPEQVEGAEADARADLFSLGAVLYQMLTGRSPFASETMIATVRKVVDVEPVAPRKLNGEVSRWLSDLTMHLLEKKPEHRPAGMKEVLLAFEQEMALRKIRRATMTGLAVALLSALLLGGLGWWWAHRAPGSTSPARPPGEALAPMAYHLGEKTFATLANAVAEAASGDTIEISGQGVANWTALDLRGKALTIRVAEGARPRFGWHARSKMIMADRPLALEGLWIDHSKHGTAGAFVAMQGAPLFISNCRFVRPGTGAKMNNISGLILVHQPEEVHVFRSVLVSVQSAALKITAQDAHPLNLHLGYNLIAASAGVAVDDACAAGGALQLTRNVLLNRNTFLMDNLSGQAPISIMAYHNYFEAPQYLVLVRNSVVEPLTDSLQWQGVGNLYEEKTVYYGSSRLAPAGRMRAVRAFVDWQALLGERSVGAHEVKLGLRDEVNIARHAAEVVSLVAEGVLEPLQGRDPAVGPDPQMLGPGEGYDAWRASEGYAGWRAMVDAAIADQ